MTAVRDDDVDIPEQPTAELMVGQVGPKPGVKTTEFWGALTSFVLFMLPALHITAAPETVRMVMAAMAAFVTASYVLTRAIVKAAHAKPAPLPPIESTTIVHPDLAAAAAVVDRVGRQKAPRRTR